MMKVILGAGNTRVEGWVSTDEDSLNLLSEESFSSFFKNGKAQAMLAEHVWEHLTYEDGVRAARLCYDFLEDGAYIRVAVPDGNLHDDAFLRLVGIGGPGPKDHPAYTHKVLYTYDKLLEVFESVGFVVKLLEYIDEKGIFHYIYWNAEDGPIGRSLRYDTRNSRERIGMASIIIDAYKPLCINLDESI